jgi:hypothetical protein
MVLRLAAGEVLCLVDADNFAGKNYAHWVNSRYAERGDKSIITTLRKDNIPYRDQGGKLGFHRELLYAVKGFDESLTGYGVDDVDLVNRLEKLGGQRVFIEESNHLKFIGHSNVERLKNHHLINNLQQMYILQTPDMELRNTLIYLLKDGTYIELELEFNEDIKYNLVLSYAGWSVKNNGYRKGILTRSRDGFTLADANGNTRVFRQETPDLVSSKNGNDWLYWRRVTEKDDMFYELIMGFGETTNRTKYMENDRNIAAVNKAGWGRGTVFCNFDYSTPIAVN